MVNSLWESRTSQECAYRFDMHLSGYIIQLCPQARHLSHKHVLRIITFWIIFTFGRLLYRLINTLVSKKQKSLNHVWFYERSLPQNRRDRGRNFNNLKQGPSSFWIFKFCLALISFTLYIDLVCRWQVFYKLEKKLGPPILQYLKSIPVWHLIHTSIKPANPLFAKLRSICCSASKCTCCIRNLSNISICIKVTYIFQKN